MTKFEEALFAAVKATMIEYTVRDLNFQFSGEFDLNPEGQLVIIGGMDVRYADDFNGTEGDVLEEIYRVKYDANPEDPALTQRIFEGVKALLVAESESTQGRTDG